MTYQDRTGAVHGGHPAGCVASRNHALRLRCHWPLQKEPPPEKIEQKFTWHWARQQSAGRIVGQTLEPGSCTRKAPATRQRAGKPSGVAEGGYRGGHQGTAAGELAQMELSQIRRCWHACFGVCMHRFFFWKRRESKRHYLHPRHCEY